MAKLVPNICVSVPNEPEHMEAECQESGAKQVPQSSQVWDGEVVGVQAAFTLLSMLDPVSLSDRTRQLTRLKRQRVKLLFIPTFLVAWPSPFPLGLLTARHGVTLKNKNIIGKRCRKRKEKQSQANPSVTS